jgi:hypothetical protein
MDFKAATEGVTADELAAAFHVSRQTIWQYRMDPSATGHRSPPAGWESVVAGILQTKGNEFLDRARLLADQLDPA